ncbi:hypothetical protein ACWDSJ_37655 [Nocardia sp. NPDC003482]
MVVLSVVISALLIAAAGVACWWLAHDQSATDLELAHRVCGRCLLDGVDHGRNCAPPAQPRPPVRAAIAPAPAASLSGGVPAPWPSRPEP